MTKSPFEEPWRYNEQEAAMTRQAIRILHQQPIPAKHPVVGEHAFCHETGVHQEAQSPPLQAVMHQAGNTREQVRALPNFQF